MFFFISFEESFLIIIIFLLLFGPNKMPEILRDINQLLTKSRNFVKSFKNNIWEEIENIRKPAKNIKNDIFEIKDKIINNSYKNIKRK